MDKVIVHVASRHDYINPKRKVLKSATDSPKKKRLRSVSSFLLKYLSSCGQFIQINKVSICMYMYLCFLHFLQDI